MAGAILASTVWSAEKLTSKTLDQSPAKRRKLNTGCQAIDSMLIGGLDYGRMTCISSEADCGSRELMHAFVASHLLDEDSGDATIIDTANGFDARGLHGQIKVLSQRKSGSMPGIEKVKGMLDRVKIMPVFDFIGMTEGLAELRDTLDTGCGSSQEVSSEPPNPRATIGDSQGEEDIMLDEASAEPMKHTVAQKSMALLHKRRGLLVIDNISHVTLPIIKSNHVHGQALLVSLLRSLHHLTRAHNLCSLLMTTATSFQHTAVDDAPSIFFSCMLRPALGKTFAHLLDTHMLLHQLPEAVEDARVVYGENGGRLRSPTKSMNVLEILQDRCHGRTGRWTAFSVDPDGSLKGIA